MYHLKLSAGRESVIASNQSKIFFFIFFFTADILTCQKSATNK